MDLYNFSNTQYITRKHITFVYDCTKVIHFSKGKTQLRKFFSNNHLTCQISPLIKNSFSLRIGFLA